MVKQCYYQNVQYVAVKIKIYKKLRSKRNSNYGAVTLEIYSTFYRNNYGNYNSIADTQCDHYIFYVNESVQICMISGETLLVGGMIKICFSFSHIFNNRKTNV